MTSGTISEIVDRISYVQGELSSERKNREDSYDLTIKRVGNEILRLNGLINQEKKTCESTYGDHYRVLKELKDRFDEDLVVI